MTAIGVRWRSVLEPMFLALLLGATAGVVVLGIGGRIAMRAIALATYVPTGFSIGGTTTVVLLGLVSGVGGALLYALLHCYIRRPRPLRSVLFAFALVLLTLRGLRPIQPLALEWFMPLALGYGVIVDIVYTRWADKRSPSSASQSTTVPYPGGG